MGLLVVLVVQMLVTTVRVGVRMMRMMMWMIVLFIRITPILVAFTVFVIGLLIKFAILSIVGVVALIKGITTSFRARRAARDSTADPAPAPFRR